MGERLVMGLGSLTSLDRHSLESEARVSIRGIGRNV